MARASVGDGDVAEAFTIDCTSVADRGSERVARSKAFCARIAVPVRCR
jgi:hypothetical protein